jgi:hypothetical protein
VARAERAGLVGLFGGMAAALALAAGVLYPRPRLSAGRSIPPPGEPGHGTVLGYIGSSACAGCHPGEHASFRRTFHRTMTQRATPDAVRAPLADGHLSARGDEVWAAVPGEAEPRRVALLTGSHREQAFWIAGARPGELRLAPFVWMVREQVFLPREEAFVVPPDAPLPAAGWASGCIACHAVAGEPRRDFEHDAFDTRAAELGVACEACHGPGGEHAARYRDPVLRYAARSRHEHDPRIVQPALLAPERSAAVCGQCHSYAFPRDERGWWTEGYSRAFRAGDLLEPSRTLLTARVGPGAPTIDAPVSALFWPDGSVRVGGREYNGLVASACFVRGEGDRKATCVSCHAMHAGDPAGQIAPDRQGDAGCTRCHDTPKDRGHAHHAAGSPGARCVACHMPKTSFALLSAVRSHRISVPEPTAAPPNACNLCHLDRSLAWTAEWLERWYGRRASVAGASRDEPFGVAAGIAGDAGLRALVADALGSPESNATCRPGFAAPILDAMRTDPYAAVRLIAARGRQGESPGTPLAEGLVAALRARRDDRPITIAE